MRTNIAARLLQALKVSDQTESVAVDGSEIFGYWRNVLTAHNFNTEFEVMENEGIGSADFGMLRIIFGSIHLDWIYIWTSHFITDVLFGLLRRVARRKPAADLKDVASIKVQRAVPAVARKASSDEPKEFQSRVRVRREALAALVSKENRKDTERMSAMSDQASDIDDVISEDEEDKARTHARTAEICKLTNSRLSFVGPYNIYVRCLFSVRYIVTYKELRNEEIAQHGESKLIMIDEELKRKLCLLEPKFVYFLLHDRRRMYNYIAIRHISKSIICEVAGIILNKRTPIRGL